MLMNKTLFTNIDYDMWLAFNRKGFNYIETNYINVFRWLWNEKHICPQFENFPGSEKSRITITDNYLYGDNIDDSVIKSVEYIYNNIDNFLEDDEYFS